MHIYTMIDAVTNNMQVDVIDAMQRKVFNRLENVIKLKYVKNILEKLPLFDLHIIDGLRSLYFDDKHNAKRLRGAVISSTRGILIGKNIITKNQLKYIFDTANISCTEILNPNYRQNVPAVLKFVESSLKIQMIKYLKSYLMV